ncbi:hypothetical protein BDV28DRAFT_144759 [Aspergillus coremiiformis]|uniref:Uncharacterized protein n=1 Tax=Aspergillus coremiiformis TaxID=138285 RepID=A0A5N6ZH65_9EURO|nr:hypothetical protein BDV28DRAFT_144759 [Aspergillus coremiiformis]
MKFAILLTALASPTLGSLFEHQTDLATQIKNLTRAPDSHGWIQLSSTGHNVQSVDATGNVLDEIPLTPEQEAELRSSFAVKVEQVQTGNSSARSAVRHRGLEKKAPGIIVMIVFGFIRGLGFVIVILSGWEGLLELSYLDVCLGLAAKAMDWLVGVGSDGESLILCR